jgi:hypothetical protein
MQDTDRRKALSALFAMGAAGAVASSAQAAPARGGAQGDLAKQVDMLVSRAAIEEILVAYARGNDRLDGDLLRSLFWPESTHRHGGFNGKSIDFINFAVKKVGELKYAAHHISNISIEVEGDRAFSECYYFAHHRRVKTDGTGEEDAFFEGRYLDDFERRAGVWKIIRRRGLSDYSPPAIPAAVRFDDWPAGQHSVRFPEDDYYAMRGAFRARR